jgi:hypothetical protein
VRIKYLNQIRHLGFTAPDELRERLRVCIVIVWHAPPPRYGRLPAARR